MLYVVATPIGNLKDITLRAVEVLKQADLIACEDTRRTKILLDEYEIQNPVVSFHQHSKVQKVDSLVDQLKAGKDIALLTDAGTPGISDPGGVLIAKAVEQGIKVVPVPGPSALSAIVSVAGMPMNKFLFLGFLPHKKGRQTMIREILSSDIPVVLFESPHRIIKTLQALAQGKGQVILGRELTKKFEEILRGTAEEVLAELNNSEVKGEFVLIYEPETN